MSDFKEFLGKTLDAAIAEACSYYDAPREKLEIEIIEDAKSGIFGIVGARKARIQARRAQLPDLGRSTRERREKSPSGESARPAPSVKEESPAEEQNEQQESAPVQQEEGRKKRSRKGNSKSPRTEEDSASGSVDLAPVSPSPSGEDVAGDFTSCDDTQEQDTSRSRRSRKGRIDQEKPLPDADAGTEQDGADLPPRVALSELDQEKLVRVSTDIVRALVESIADNPTIDVSIGQDRLQIRVDSADTGLLIGRDGQNLAAVQYLATRMIARAMDAQIRLQLDAGDYHSRQDSRLQELALSLAEKVKLTGRSQSTRPLSAYQRRLIHLCLQDDPDVQTRSSGEGAMKRVVILRRKDKDLPEE